MGFPQTEKGLQIGMITGSTSGSIPTLAFHSGETQSAGHDLYFMDYRAVDENGEPRIVLIDNEMSNAVTVVAKDLEEFLTKIYHHEEV